MGHEGQPGLLVFPTLVGVFPLPTWSDARAGSLPHARGGVSAVRDGNISAIVSSPRSWRCFRPLTLTFSTDWVFPTLVGVFLTIISFCSVYVSLPHARGGVSSGICGPGPRPWSSPRSWGCFLVLSGDIGDGLVFPTLVGVFPEASKSLPSNDGLPHARGGVSIWEGEPLTHAKSSPRSWGCF